MNTIYNIEWDQFNFIHIRDKQDKVRYSEKNIRKGSNAIPHNVSLTHASEITKNLKTCSCCHVFLMLIVFFQVLLLLSFLKVFYYHFDNLYFYQIILIAIIITLNCIGKTHLVQTIWNNIIFCCRWCAENFEKCFLQQLGNFCMLTLSYG